MGDWVTMTMVNPELIARYQETLRTDPNSRIFAPLAEALRREGKLSEAFTLCSDGVRRHPEFAGGRVSLAKILVDQKKFAEAKDHLFKAVTLAPENIMAHHLLAEIALELRRPKEALKSFKMILFLNPADAKSKMAIRKLETLTADEFVDEVFEFEPGFTATPKKNMPAAASPAATLDLERALSLADAYIVRNDITKAEKTLLEAQARLGNLTEIESRLERIRETYEVEQDIAPLRSRRQVMLESKIDYLEGLLQGINTLRERT